MITFKEEKALKDYDAVSLAEILRQHFIETYPLAEVNKLNDAIQVASYLHREDVRRGARGKTVKPPYIEHPLRVAIRMAKDFHVTKSDAIIAAVLHDTVEDHPFEFAEFEGVPTTTKRDGEEVARSRAIQFISQKFSYSVASLVADVTNPVVPKDMPKADKLALYHGHVQYIAATSEGGLLIKVSDFVDNAGSLHHHYAYDDPKAQYFIDRYEPLLPIYRNVLNMSAYSFDVGRVAERIDLVEEQFTRFRAAA